MLRIELLDDCNIVSGEAYNSYLKEDVFYDKYGLPYIPAWFIKNQLYEIAKGIANRDVQEHMTDIFGINCAAKLIFDDALIADRESLRQAIIQEEGILLTDPQRILSFCNFTTVKKKFFKDSAHYVRVLNKGLIFEQYFILDEKYRAAFECCIDHFNSLVTDHEVGILCSIDWNEDKPQLPFGQYAECKAKSTYRLHYRIYVLSKTCFDNPIETKATSAQYVPGYEILRVLSEKIVDDFETFFYEGNIKCSFAYRDIKGQRSIPMPLSYSKLKVDQTQLRDKLSEGRRPDDFDQLNSLSEMYIGNFDATETESITVKMENGLLKFLDKGTIKTKKYNAISEGQIFRGFIDGSSSQIERIKEAFQDNGYIRLGNFTEIGFGNCYFSIDEIIEQKAAEPTIVKSFNVEAISPIALYNDNGLCQAWANKIVEEFESILGCKLELVKNYQATSKLTQFNRNWNEFSPITYNIDGGSVFRIKRADSEEIDISSIVDGGFIGEHNAMGYGEFLVRPAVDIYYRELKTISEKCVNIGFTPHVDPKPGRYLIRHLEELKMKSISRQLGKKDAADGFLRLFFDNTYPAVSTAMGSHPDTIQVIDEYLEGMKEYCHNTIRRERNDR